MKKTLSLLLITVFFITSCGKKNTPNPTPVTPTTPTVNVSTFAGSGIAGSANGAGTAASFQQPVDIGIDVNGNFYVVDVASSGPNVGNNLIRKITPAGVVTTFFGIGYNPSNGLAPYFFPEGVATDGSGNVYVTDLAALGNSAGGNVILKISPSGVATTVAGGVQGFVNGTGTAASFASPLGIVVDASGNVYVADDNNNAIREITPASVVTTLAGNGVAGESNGTGTAASFNGPQYLAIDASGNLYVADTGNNLIRKITSAGVVTTVAGNGQAGATNGTGTAASFNRPTGIAIDASGNLYVTDTGNNLIRKITPAGVVTTIAGNGSQGSTNGSGTLASFNAPFGITIDAAGNLYVADYGNNLIRKISF